MSMTEDFENPQVPGHTFVLFGATGDLAKRKLYPALYNLHRNNLLTDCWTLIGSARRPHDDASFQKEVRSSVQNFGRLTITDEDDWTEFASHFHYQVVHSESDEDFSALRERVEVYEQAGSVPPNRLFYLAMSPEFFGMVALRLKNSGLTSGAGWKRLIIEKPFGRDHDSALELNNQLREVFEEDEIFRIDHYLGKEMVQNIEVLRFANSMFEPIWNNRSIANVQITSSETVGVEDRAGYYEKSGALRDMVQNHILQMVMMIAMEPPSHLRTEAIRDEKVKVLRSLRRYASEEIPLHVVRGQYSNGTIGEKDLPAYSEEPGVAANSQTETFIAARLFIDNFRWAGVPFYIRTGKRMHCKATEIVIQFKDLPRNLYFNRDGGLGPNLLVIRVNPVEGMYLQLNAKRPGTDGTVIPIAMEFSQKADKSPEAYERLLHDAMRGDSTFFTRWDEVSLAWRFVDPLADAFAHNPQSTLHLYASGSPGPEAAQDLLLQDDFNWWPIYGVEAALSGEVVEHKYARTVEVVE